MVHRACTRYSCASALTVMSSANQIRAEEVGGGVALSDCRCAVLGHLRENNFIPKQPGEAPLKR